MNCDSRAKKKKEQEKQKQQNKTMIAVSLHHEFYSLYFHIQKLNQVWKSTHFIQYKYIFLWLQKKKH